MNQPLPHNDSRFDRLVDGELSETEYRVLLASLDDEPGGWRRCALSFLEAQAPERELGSLRRERVEPAPLPTPASNSIRSGVRISAPWMVLAMAASFLVAFGLGMAIRHDGTPATNAPQIAENEPSPTARPNELAATTNNSPEAGNSRSPLAGQRNQPLGNVTLVVDGQEPSQQQRVEVPLYNYDQVADDYFTHDQSALPPEMRELLERNGHELRRHRQLVPLTLDNGQQAVFPMEEVEIMPVRMPAF